MELSIALSLINYVTDYQSDYCANGYQKALESAKQLATELNVEIIFKGKRIRRKKRFFDYESTDEVSKACKLEACFKNRLLNVISDTAINSISERFEQLKRFNDAGEFLEQGCQSVGPRA